MPSGKKYPRLLENVLQAVAELEECSCATVNNILARVETAVEKGESKKKKQGNLVEQVRKAIKHGIDNGVLKRRSGRIMLTIGRATIEQQMSVKREEPAAEAASKCPSKPEKLACKKPGDKPASEAGSLSLAPTPNNSLPAQSKSMKSDKTDKTNKASKSPKSMRSQKQLVAEGRVSKRRLSRSTTRRRRRSPEKRDRSEQSNNSKKSNTSSNNENRSQYQDSFPNLSETPNCGNPDCLCNFNGEKDVENDNRFT